jgi:anti-sigma-K factor RskA
VYEVWFIKDKTPVGVGTFTVDAQGNGQIVVDAPAAIGSYQIAALTEEPQGGSLSPTSDVLMAGQF